VKVKQIMMAAAAAALVSVTGPAAANEVTLPFSDHDACREGPMAQFGRYIGDWKIEDRQLRADGSGWEPGDGARWIFTCLGNGMAVQDFWIPGDGNVGTNLRTWNPETGAWDIAWAIDTLPGFAHIRAKQQDSGNIVMMYESPIPDPLRRITFFPPDEDGWNWQLEYSRDDGKTWTVVYRIRATPWPGSG
jgi:hypothetical protein